jgi:hypothetical protein
MPEETAGRHDLEPVLARFPAQQGLARRLFLSSAAFRSTCEDYRLARQGLVTFEQLAATQPRAELQEYRTLVEELEVELQRMLGPAGPDDAATAPRRAR